VATLLTTVANVEAWIGDITPGSSAATDALIARLIAAASRAIYSRLGRPSLFPNTYTETRDGTGGPRLMLRRWPVTSVSALSIDGTSILAGSYGNAAGTDGLAGYFFETWDGMPPGRRPVLTLGSSVRFTRGAQNVTVTYRAGYQVTSEAATVDAAATPANSVTAQAAYGSWATDEGVTYADGTALTAVAGAPAAGEYQISTATPGVYIFNTADAGAGVLVSYGFVPSDIEEACIQLVSERYAYRSRVGVRSKSLGGQETMSYDRSPLPPEVMDMLMPYKAVGYV
jgi:hypothetical protein